MAFSFGTPAASQPAPTFSFGTPQASTSTASPGTGLFGSTTTPSIGGGGGTGLFGSSTAPAAGSLFGSNPASQNKPLFTSAAPASSSSNAASIPSFSFGAPKPATPGIGQSTAQPFSFGSSSLFGGNANNTPSTSLLGQQPLQSSLTQSQQQQQPQTSLSQSILQPQQEQPIEDRIQKLVAAWDASNPQCAFQYYVYNIMDPARAEWVKANGHQRTPQDVNDALWNKALRENPDPARCYPHLVTGIDALKKRVGQQDEFAAKHAGKLDELVSSLQSLSSKYNLDTSLRINQATHTQAVLSARLLRLVSRLHSLTPLRGSPIRAEEEELRVKIEKLLHSFAGKKLSDEELLYNPSAAAHSGKLSSKVNEAWVQVAQRKAKKAMMQGQGDVGWAVVDEHEVDKVLDVLAQQQRTLDYLADILKTDQKTVDVVKQGFGL